MGNVAKLCSEDAISAFLEVYDKFERVSCNQGETIVVGPYTLDATHNDVRLVEDFKLQIIVPAGYPNSLPKVKEISGIIEREYEHLYPDGTLCLGIQGELLIAQLKNPSLTALLDGPVCSYLYSYLYHKRYRRYPFGDRAHGASGILQYYEELFREPNPIKTISLLKTVCSDSYRGHLPCPCGSGLISRKCHGEIILELKNSGAITALVNDFKTIVDELAINQILAQRRKQALHRIFENSKVAIVQAQS